MIKYAGGKYMDVVALVPVTNFTAEFLYHQYNYIKKSLWEIGFTVIALSVDNHTVNRQFYTQYLCDNVLQTSICHSQDVMKTDTVHNLKNVNNYFQ
uniref:Putative LOC101234274 [Hydra vulgaris] n=1 Tax=Lepeophtheirus salmonis TaxID=72036 RepID=A0A0K2T567_LEPSM